MKNRESLWAVAFSREAIAAISAALAAEVLFPLLTEIAESLVIETKAHQSEQKANEIHPSMKIQLNCLQVIENRRSALSPSVNLFAGFSA